jgi:two-component system, response regulator FlrC
MRLTITGTLEGQIGEAISIATRRGAKVTHYINPDDAVTALLAGKGADIIMVDVEEDVARFINSLRTNRISVPIIACGISRNKEAAVRAIKAGAKEYIPLPPDEELIAAVLESISAETRSVLYTSEAMQRVITMVEQVAPSDASILITGESGTGKEVIARYIHEKSKRADKPFISVNCAAIPENLLESELFGHEKGAFTGALHRRIGKFEEANTGTLLLDEISEMDLKLQAKLLRAIQEREFDRVGSNAPVKVDIRIIATSNRDMMSYIKQGKFREDLYYRLNVISTELPPLRERDGDIILLAKYFVEKYSKANGLPPRPLSANAETKLDAYDWPGNVRELENTMHRAVLMAQHATIDERAIMLPDMDDEEMFGDTPQPHLPIERNVTPIGASYANDAKLASLIGRTVADVEKDLILQTLDHCLGNRTHAANILGISIRTLRNKLRQYGDIVEQVGT